MGPKFGSKMTHFHHNPIPIGQNTSNDQLLIFDPKIDPKNWSNYFTPLGEERESKFTQIFAEWGGVK